jgi:hypothetical protein
MERPAGRSPRVFTRTRHTGLIDVGQDGRPSLGHGVKDHDHRSIRPPVGSEGHSRRSTVHQEPRTVSQHALPPPTAHVDVDPEPAEVGLQRPNVSTPSAVAPRTRRRCLTSTFVRDDERHGAPATDPRRSTKGRRNGLGAVDGAQLTTWRGTSRHDRTSRHHTPSQRVSQATSRHRRGLHSKLTVGCPSLRVRDG